MDSSLVRACVGLCLNVRECIDLYLCVCLSVLVQFRYPHLRNFAIRVCEPCGRTLREHSERDSADTQGLRSPLGTAADSEPEPLAEDAQQALGYPATPPPVHGRVDHPSHGYAGREPRVQVDASLSPPPSKGVSGFC